MELIAALVKEQESLWKADERETGFASMMHGNVNFLECFDVEHRLTPVCVKSYSKNTFVVTAKMKTSAKLRNAPGVRLPAPGARVALKFLILPRRSSDAKTRELLAGVTAEAQAMWLLRHSQAHCGHHPNIQQYYGWFVCEQQTDLVAEYLSVLDPSFSSEALPLVEKQFLPAAVVIVEEFYPTLLRVDNDNGPSGMSMVVDGDGGPFTNRSFFHAVPNAYAHLTMLMRDVKEALLFLSEKKVSHLSIKASNIAIVQDNSAALIVPTAGAAELLAPQGEKKRADKPAQASSSHSSARYCAVLLNFQHCRIFSDEDTVWDRGLASGPATLPPALSEGDAAARLLGNRTSGAGDMRVLPYRDADFYSLLRLEYSVMTRELSGKSEELRVTHATMARTKQQLQQLQGQFQTTRTALVQRSMEVDQLQAALAQCMQERDTYMHQWKPPESSHVLTSAESLARLLDAMNNLKHPVLLHLAVDRHGGTTTRASSAAVDDEWLTMLALQNNVFIATLDLEGCNRVSDESVRAVARRSSQLSHVNLYGCQISDGTVAVIAKNCPILQFLFVQGAFVTDFSIGEVATSPCAAALRHLHLHGCNVTDAALIAVAHACTRLESLHLNLCVHITDEAVDAVASSCLGLMSLALAGSSHLTDRALIAISSSLRRLVRLDMSMCPQLTDISVLNIGLRPQTAAPAGRSMSRPIAASGAPPADPSVPLERVDLGGCRKLTDRSFFHLLAKCTALKHLGMSACKHLTASFAILQKCKGHVGKIDMSVSNDEVIAMMFGDDYTADWGKMFPTELASVDLSFCPKVSPGAICQIASQLQLSLEAINLSGCSNVTGDTVEDIIEMCVKVRSIGIAKCDAIFDYTVNELRCKYPNISFNCVTVGGN